MASSIAAEITPVKFMQKRVDPRPILTKMREDKIRCENEIMHIWNHATKVAQKEADYPWKLYDTLNVGHKKKSVLDAYLQDEFMQEEVEQNNRSQQLGKKGAQSSNKNNEKS